MSRSGALPRLRHKCSSFLPRAARIRAMAGWQHGLVRWRSTWMVGGLNLALLLSWLWLFAPTLGWLGAGFASGDRRLNLALLLVAGALVFGRAIAAGWRPLGWLA